MCLEFSRKFWENLEDFQRFCKRNYMVCETADIPKKEVEKRIEDVIFHVMQLDSVETPPYLLVRSRQDWRNVVYIPNVGLKMVSTEKANIKTISIANESSQKKFGLILKVLSMIYKLLKTDQVATKRDLYYEEVNMFSSQSMLDQIIDEVACMLEVPRRWLNVVATSKGLMTGDLIFTGVNGETIDCSYSSTLVPSQIDLIDNICSKSAKFILVVEKDATFQRLVDDDFCQDMPCIMITGKGIPDLNTRMMIRRIWNVLQIPVFGLMDADPYGIEIMCVYRFGSLSQSFDTLSLALPFMRWIGIFPSDINRLHLPADGVTKMTARDESKCRDLLARPYMSYHPHLQQEIEEMLLAMNKAEIQSLTKISPIYLNKVFIAAKIKHGEWI